MYNPEGERAGSSRQSLINAEKKGGNQNGKLQANFMQSRLKGVASDAKHYCVIGGEVGGGFCARAVQEELRQEEVNLN